MAWANLSLNSPEGRRLAVKYAKQALNLLSDSSGAETARCYYILGYAAKDQNQLETSAEYFLDALNYYRDSQGDYYKPWTYEHLASIEEKKGHLGRALTLMRESREAMLALEKSATAPGVQHIQSRLNQLQADLSAAQLNAQKKGPAQANKPADPAGLYDAGDWGVVRVEPCNRTYRGTYSNRYTGSNGQIEFDLTTGRGVWGSLSGGGAGTIEIRSIDNDEVHLFWKVSDAKTSAAYNKKWPKSGTSIWIKVL
jgi:hypothetical protein